MTREDLMVQAYGEVTTKAEAQRILTVSRRTLDQIIADGKIELACEGTKVDVRSIANYIETPVKKMRRVTA